MTKTQDNLARDAARAAVLIKQTAESTATALNIQYMQKDIAEIKDGIKALAANQDGKIEAMENRVDTLSKIVYTGMGILMAAEVVFKFFVK